jgi:hypothetical protein
VPSEMMCSGTLMTSTCLRQRSGRFERDFPCSPLPNAASRRGSGRHYRHEGFAMSRHAPDSSQQLAHRRDHRSEEKVGCCAVGTCLHTGAPVQVAWEENYILNLKDWASMAAPIHHPITGEVLGAIGAAGHGKSSHPRAFDLLVQSAELIEGRIREQIANDRLLVLEQFAQYASRYPADGLLALDNEKFARVRAICDFAWTRRATPAALIGGNTANPIRARFCWVHGCSLTLRIHRSNRSNFLSIESAVAFTAAPRARPKSSAVASHRNRRAGVDRYRLGWGGLNRGAQALADHAVHPSRHSLGDLAEMLD